nr:hypothetical protein CFP56_73821 [Quercus suber]
MDESYHRRRRCTVSSIMNTEQKMSSHSQKQSHGPSQPFGTRPTSHQNKESRGGPCVDTSDRNNATRRDGDSRKRLEIEQVRRDRLERTEDWLDVFIVRCSLIISHDSIAAGMIHSGPKKTKNHDREQSSENPSPSRHPSLHLKPEPGAP